MAVCLGVGGGGQQKGEGGCFVASDFLTKKKIPSEISV